MDIEFYIWNIIRSRGKYFNGRSWGSYAKRKLYTTLAGVRAARGKYGGIIVTVTPEKLLT